MTPLKSYLIRAIYEWIVDNAFTPYLLVDAHYPQVLVPDQFVQDGRITLNIRPQAVEALSLGNQAIEFNTRFHSKATYIHVPVSAVIAIYAKENGKGMVFELEETPPHEPEPPKPPPKTKPKLRVIK